MCYDDWSLKILEWHPPSPNDYESDMKFNEFMKISVDTNGQVKKELIFVLDFHNEELGHIIDNDIEIALPRNNKNDIMSINLHLQNPAGYEMSHHLYIEMVSKFVDFCGANDHHSYMCEEKFATRIGCRNAFEFQRLAPEIVKNGFTVRPIQSGVFKGTYSSHGIEMIKVSYVESDGVSKLEGLKLTGDPNVPFNKVSFYADLTKPIVLTEEFQRESRCDDLISGIDESSLNLEEPMPSQPFIKPRDAFVDDSRFNQRMCRYRFKGNFPLFDLIE